LTSFRERLVTGTWYFVQYDDGSTSEIQANAYQAHSVGTPPQAPPGRTVVTSYAKDKFNTVDGKLHAGDIAYVDDPRALVCLPTADNSETIVPLFAYVPGVTLSRQGVNITTNRDVPIPTTSL
jgi:hypothetical protein